MAKTKKNKGGGGTRKKSKSKKTRGFKKPGVALGGMGTQEKPKVENPFEIRMSRSKHDNLGKRARHERGAPGISRSKAIDKRKETLLKEYKVRNKSSVLVDKRIGEKIKNMSEEEKIIKRSLVEKRRQYKQKSIFNLPSTDDILTHKGQVLMDIDRYEDPRDGSDSEDERLNEEFVSDAHFAGDFLKVKSKASDEIDDDEGKSRGDIIAELILNSKKRKLEKAKEADENYELVTRLDQEFKTPDFRNLLTFVKKDNVETKEAVPPKKEDYDKIVRELHFEAKTGQAANRLKTEDEIQDEELEKLKKLEKERIRRMRAQDPTTPKYKSADDLADDSFDLSDDIPTISYQEDGTLNKIDDDEEEDEDESAENEEASEEEEDEEDSDDDAYSDLESDNEEKESQGSKSKSKATKSRTGTAANDFVVFENDDIPFTLGLPKSYESFVKLLTKYHALITDNKKCVDRFKAVVERIVQYSLLADKSRLPDLFVYLLRLIIEAVETSMSIGENIQRMIDISTVNLHTVLLTNTEACVARLETDIIQRLFQSPQKDKPNGAILLSKIALYGICSKLFCVTDFCHKVLSPIKADMLSLINSYNISNFIDLIRILAMSDILHGMSKESKRYCPEIMKFLVDILEAISLPKDKLRYKRRRFEFLGESNIESDMSDWNSNIYELEITNEVPTGGQIKSLLLRVFDFANSIIENSHRTKAFNNLIFLVMKMEYQILLFKWEDKKFLEALFKRKLCISIITPEENLVEDELPTAPSDRPKMLKLYEPMIEENFDGNKRRKHKQKGMTQEEARLNHKVKKEMKSATREILKDNAFLAKQQLKEQSMKDAERSRKVKELLGSLSNQEGDYRRLKRQK